MQQTEVLKLDFPGLERNFNTTNCKLLFFILGCSDGLNGEKLLQSCYFPLFLSPVWSLSQKVKKSLIYKVLEVTLFYQRIDSSHFLVSLGTCLTVLVIFRNKHWSTWIFRQHKRMWMSKKHPHTFLTCVAIDYHVRLTAQKVMGEWDCRFHPRVSA